jgi:hypothetical protein
VKLNVSFIAASLFLSLLAGCCKEETINKPIEGRITNYTDCKQFTKSIETGDDKSCVEYSYDASAKALILKHINGGFNCCPDGLYCEVEISGNTIIVEEFENAALCNCECLFDVDIKIDGLESGMYRIRFIEPYCGDQEELEFTVDFTESPTGTYCVTRTQYPWGIYN